MRRTLSKFVLGLVVSTAGAASAGPTALEENKVASLPGWHLDGSTKDSYLAGPDKAVKHGGGASASLHSISDPKDGFGSLHQTISAEKFRGKRLRFAAWLKADKSVKDWTGLWMRVDGKDYPTLAFDNMNSRKVKGGTDWKRYEVVLDVADSAHAISFGTLLVGPGKVWLDDAQLQVVDKSIPTTSIVPANPAASPVNLAFEG